MRLVFMQLGVLALTHASSTSIKVVYIFVFLVFSHVFEGEEQDKASNGNNWIEKHEYNLVLSIWDI